MRLLLDTHTLIFALTSKEMLKPEAVVALSNPENEVYFSAANIWEIEIKVKLGKLQRPTLRVAAAARKLGCVELPITAEHAEVAGRLELYHHDPFDRILIAQATVEGLTVVTRDRAFDEYGVSILAC